jgi:hypothetical protein
LIGWFADKIFKGDRPKDLSGDLTASILTMVLVGLLDWFVIPAMGFSETLKLVGVVLEPPLAALIVLWLMRRASN